MQETREFQGPLAAEKDHMLVCCLEAFELQVIFKPQPAEHLDYHRWSEHEPDDQAEPEEIPMTEKRLRQPQVRAHVKHIRTHTDHTKHEIQPRVSGEHRGVHGEDLGQWNYATFFPSFLYRKFGKLQKVEENSDCWFPLVATSLNTSMLQAQCNIRAATLRINWPSNSEEVAYFFLVWNKHRPFCDTIPPTWQSICIWFT